MQVENTLAYYNTAIITAVKMFIVQAPVLNDNSKSKLFLWCYKQHGSYALQC
jgi:hypothetical protein